MNTGKFTILYNYVLKEASWKKPSSVLIYIYKTQSIYTSLVLKVNTLAFYNMAKIRAVKNFIVQDPIVKQSGAT